MNASARLRRTLSQNFLADAAVLRRFVRGVDPAPGSLVVEIGAGDGRITAALAARGPRITAYELDPRLARRLTERGLPRVRCVNGDFLRSSPPREPFTAVGNIPYAVTAPIVDWCLAAPELTSAHLITQLEYARKRTGDYGRWSLLTVLSWPDFDWRLGERVDRRAFRPVPRVDSAVLRLERRDRPLLPARLRGAYRRAVMLGFEGRGGSVHASLRRAHSRGALDAAFRAAGLDRDVIVAHVHPDQWVTLVRRLAG